MSTPKGRFFAWFRTVKRDQGDSALGQPQKQPVSPRNERAEEARLSERTLGLGASRGSPRAVPVRTGVDENSTVHPRAPVSGPLRIDPVIVGEPGPFVESVPTDHKFRTFPFRPDTVIDSWSTPEIAYRGASLRGQSHRFYGDPRQDDFAMHALESGRCVVAVADGVGNCRHAHIGATTAVRHVVRWLASNASNVGDRVDWKTVIDGAAWSIVKQAQTVLGLEEPDPDLAVKHFSTTLVVAVIDPQDDGVLDIEIVDIGDSSAWLLSKKAGFRPLITGKSDDESSGISSSAVFGLPRVPALPTVGVAHLELDDVLLIGTDGIGDPLGDGDGSVGGVFSDICLRGELPSPIEFAHAVDFSRRSFDDDRTLVAVWPRAGVR